MMSSVTFRKMHQKIATKKIETEIILGPVTKQRVPTMYKLFCFFQTFWDKKYYFLFRDYNCDLYVSVNIKAVFKFI